LLLGVAGPEWKGTHILAQNSNDHAPLVRHSGDGNPVLFVSRAAGALLSPSAEGADSNEGSDCADCESAEGSEFEGKDEEAEDEESPFADAHFDAPEDPLAQ
jgi:hypothetical protein